MIFDITCDECGMVVGHVEFEQDQGDENIKKSTSGYICKECAENG